MDSIFMLPLRSLFSWRSLPALPVPPASSAVVAKPASCVAFIAKGWARSFRWMKMETHRKKWNIILRMIPSSNINDTDSSSIIQTHDSHHLWLNSFISTKKTVACFDLFIWNPNVPINDELKRICVWRHWFPKWPLLCFQRCGLERFRPSNNGVNTFQFQVLRWMLYLLLYLRI